MIESAESELVIILNESNETETTDEKDAPQLKREGQVNLKIAYLRETREEVMEEPGVLAGSRSEFEARMPHRPPKDPFGVAVLN
jgi:hypothetical protein